MIIPLDDNHRIISDKWCWKLQELTGDTKKVWISRTYYQDPFNAIKAAAMFEVKDIPNTLAFHQAIEMMLEIFSKYEDVLNVSAGEVSNARVT